MFLTNDESSESAIAPPVLNSQAYPIANAKPGKQTAQMVVRHAEPKDCDELHRLLTHADIANWTVGVPFASLEQVSRTILPSNDQQYTLVATSSLDELMGVVRLEVYAAARLRHVARIGPLAVSPDWQGQGVGAQLLRQVLTLADDWLNLHRLELLVYANNPGAIALYEKHGFAIEGTLRDVAFQGGHYIDAHIMSRLRRHAITA